MKSAYMPLMLVVCLGLIVILRFGFIFLLLALLPSLVAFYIDNDRGKPTFQVVFACNLTATLQTILPMMMAGLKFKNYDILPVLLDSKVWLLAYLGAATGWCIIYLCRFVARFFLAITYEYNARALKIEQKKLVEEWGPDITQPLTNNPKKKPEAA